MTLLFMDGFDAKDAASKWTPGAVHAYSSSTRFSAGFAAVLDNEGSNLKQFFTAASQLFVGFAFRQDTSNTNTSVPFLEMLGDSGATVHMNLRLNGTSLQLCRGSTVVGTASGILAANAWNYLEISATVDPTSGSAAVRLNGTSIISFTGNTKNGGTNTTLDTLYLSGLFGGGGQNSCYFDDLYILNSSGGANNTFLGDSRVQTLLPDAAGTYTQLAPTGSGTNYLNVNEVPDNTATYNGSATSTQRDTYGLGDLVAGTGTIYGLQQVSSMFKSAAGTASMKPALYTGAALYYGASRTLSTSPTTYLDMFETSPATSAAWTATNVNALEAGAEVV